MLTLTETAALTKKSFIIFVIFIVVSFLGWASWQYYYNFIYLPSLPIVEEQPDLHFGKLPILNLPEIKAPQNVNYILNTETGNLPTDIPKLFKVYSVAALGTDLLALDNAKKLAKDLGFEENPQALTSTQYSFLDSKGGELRIDVDTGNFAFTKTESTESARFDENYFSDQPKIVDDFKRFLSNKRLLKDDLKDSPSKIFLNQTSVRESTKADISIWQASVDEIPIVTAKFNKGLINSTVNKNADDDERYLNLEYIYWPIDLNNVGTYPLKKAEEAFEELKNGAASMVIPDDPKSLTSSTVSITKIYLAYLLTEEYSPFLQPVYVFEGENFVSLVHAIDKAEVNSN